MRKFTTWYLEAAVEIATEILKAGLAVTVEPFEDVYTVSWTPRKEGEDAVQQGS